MSGVYDISTDPLALGLVCKLCVIERYSAKLPAKIAQQKRYSTDVELRHHLAMHEEGAGIARAGLDNTSWPFLVEEARRLAAGFAMACGDVECTYHVLHCLHCDHLTSDPVAVALLRCPNCERTYSDLGVLP
jgi:hypothetical protein